MRAKDIIPAEKPRNFVAKNAMKTTSGAGQHKDKKRADKQGDVKHKDKEYAEGVAEGEQDLSRIEAGRKVLVPHPRHGKMVPGKIVRYNVNKGRVAPAYEVDIGEPETIQVTPNKVVKQGQGVAEGGIFDSDRPEIGDTVKHRNGAVGRVKRIGTQGNTTNIYFKDAKTGEMNFGEWKKHVFPVKQQGVAEGFVTDMVSAGHKIISNRKTPNGDFVVLQNKNDGKYEIHRFVGPGSTTGYEFMSAYKTPQEMQAAFKKLTGVDEGVAEGKKSGPKRYKEYNDWLKEVRDTYGPDAVIKYHPTDSMAKAVYYNGKYVGFYKGTNQTGEVQPKQDVAEAAKKGIA